MCVKEGDQYPCELKLINYHTFFSWVVLHTQRAALLLKVDAIEPKASIDSNG